MLIAKTKHYLPHQEIDEHTMAQALALDLEYWEYLQKSIHGEQ